MFSFLGDPRRRGQSPTHKGGGSEEPPKVPSDLRARERERERAEATLGTGSPPTESPSPAKPICCPHVVGRQPHSSILIARRLAQETRARATAGHDAHLEGSSLGRRWPGITQAFVAPFRLTASTPAAKETGSDVLVHTPLHTHTPAHTPCSLVRGTKGKVLPRAQGGLAPCLKQSSLLLPQAVFLSRAL